MQSHSRDLPVNLLSGYKMQWALSRPLGIRSENRSIPVNAYKLATQSATFRHLIKELDDQQKRNRGNNSSQHHHEPRELPLLIDCHRGEDINDLAFAIHFCHLGRCQVSATSVIERSDTPPMKRRGDQLRIVGADQVLVSTGQVHLTRDLAECTLTCGLRVANTYGIKSLHKLCISYLTENLTNETCWALWRAIFTRTTNATETQIFQVDARAGEVLARFMHANFRSLLHQGGLSGDFAGLSAPELELILASNCLNVRSEADVVSALQTWIESRTGDLEAEAFLPKVIPRLIERCVRVDQLSIEQVDTLLQLPGVRSKKINSSKPEENSTYQTYTASTPLNVGWKGDVRNMCIAMLHQTRRRLVRTTRNLRPLSSRSHEALASNLPNPQHQGISEQASSEPTLLNNVKLPPRIPHEAIIVLGGWENGQACKNARVLDSRQRTWINHTDPSTSTLVLPHSLMSFGITNVANQTIYIAGGESRSGQATQEVLRYELTEGANSVGWRGCAPMHDIRRDLLLINFQNKTLYAIGGDNNRAVLDSVESLSLEPKAKTNSWMEMASMIMPRGAPAGEAVGSRIYVCGGYTESRMESLTSSCEAYNPEANQWTLVQPMAQPRYYASAVSYGGHLFILGGGGDNSSRLSTSIMTLGYSSTVERFSPEDGIWELMPAISERADFASCVHEDEIYCIGGGGEAFCTAEIESWRPWIGRIRGHSISTSYPWDTDGAEGGDDGFGSPASTEEEIPGPSAPATPIWMPQSEGDATDSTRPRPVSSATQTTQTHLEGWHRGVQLPVPVWGHRCVSVKGVEKIMPLIRREEQGSSGTSHTALKCLVQHRWKIARTEGEVILEIKDSCSPILEEHEDEDGEQVESRECEQGTEIEFRIGTKTTVLKY